MDKSESWKRQFFTIYLGQGFSLLSSSAIQFSIICPPVVPMTMAAVSIPEDRAN